MNFAINPKLLPLKLHYFTHCGSIAPVLPYLAVLGRRIGFSGTVTGVIFMTIPLCGMLARPLVGAISDKLQMTKSLLIIIEILAAATMIPINYIPQLPSESKIRTMCPDGTLLMDTTTKRFVDIPENFSEILRMEKMVITCMIDCPSEFKNMNLTVVTENVMVDNGSIYFPVTYIECSREEMICNIVCDSIVVNEFLSTRENNNLADVIYHYQFWVYFILMIVSWTGQNILSSLSDTVCCGMLDDPHLYGQQKLWGSFGWGIFAIASGLITDAVSVDQFHKNYTWAFGILVVLTILDVIFTAKLENVIVEKSHSILSDVCKLLTDVQIVTYILWVMVVGMYSALFWSFFLWLIEDLGHKNPSTLPSLKTIEGLVFGFRCFFGELPLFYLSGWIIKRLGPYNCMCLILLLDGIRLLLYTVVPNPWWIIPIEVIAGVTFGLFYSTMVTQAKIISPSGTEATVQGLVGSVFDSVGLSFGNLIGGIFFDMFGGKTLFVIFSFFTFTCLFALIIAQYFIRRFKLSQRNTNQNQEVAV